MATLFQAYELLANSGLFDVDYYLQSNPDIVALNVDPLMHYLEFGAKEGRGPRRDFDVAYYVAQCRMRGEEPANPLLHFITVGAREGIKTQPPAEPDPPVAGSQRTDEAAPAAPAGGNVAEGEAPTAVARAFMQLFVDSAQVDDEGMLAIVGWAVCLAPVSSVQVFLDDEKLAIAEHGRRREDVASIHGDYPDALHSGFSLRMDMSSHSGGDRVVKVVATASTGISREKKLPLKLSGERRAGVTHRDDNKAQVFCDVIEVTTGGRITISGWAVTAAATERLSVLLDGTAIGEANIGIERPDVGNRFPALAHARRSGFSFLRAGPPVGDGEHLVVLRLLAAGEETEILLPVLAVEGSGAGAIAMPSQASGDERHLNVDLPKVIDGSATAPIRGNLQIGGWALARRGVASIDVEIDGEPIKAAQTGIRRLDVQKAFPDWEGAANPGFSAMLPHRALPRGEHTLGVALRDTSGEVSRTKFRINVEDAPDAEGPWSLRRRMGPAEIDLMSRPLTRLAQRPIFGIVMPLPSGGASLVDARSTLAALDAQVYGDWRLYLLTSRMRQREALLDSLLVGFETLRHRVQVLAGDPAFAKAMLAGDKPSHLMVLEPGDDLSCDALLEFAVHTALHPDADFFYADERRVNPASGKVDAFFKPQWSPDLLLSTNYVGRAWCASAGTFTRGAIHAEELMSPAGYHLVLRLTEHATAVRHVGATLLQAKQAPRDEAIERKALQDALYRRRISAQVSPGRIDGTFRVKRKVVTRGLVSIIIPTCAARGLVKVCLNTLRSLTAYRNIEIVCIENIPPDKKDWKDWVRANSDTVIETTEPFNWSRFNNLAVAASRGEFLLFLNDDIEIIDPAWLDTLREQVERPEVGAVGPQLLYPDRRVQHAGLFLADLGTARHAFRHAGEDDPGYFGLALTQREVIAVTGACLLTRRKVFEELGRFNETHDIVNNDVGYCLRVFRSGLRTIYTPHTRLIHHELASRGELGDNYNAEAFKSKWRSLFMAGDPFHHPRLAKDRDDYSIEWEPVEVLCAGHPVLPRDSIKRILIVKLDHIGDCVTALPAIRRLQRHFPSARITVLTGRASRAIWGLEPAVAETIEFDFFNARSGLGMVDRTEKDWSDLAERLLPYRFDLAIDMRKHGETRPVLQHCGARYLAGFDTKGKFPWLDVSLEWSEDIALIPKRTQTTDELINLVDAIAASGEVDRSVIAQIPTPLPDAALAAVPKAERIFRKRVVCVHPAVGNELRQWPAEHFSVLIDQIIEAEDVHVIVIGGPDEAALGAKVLASVRNRKSVWSVIGCVKLGELPALIGRCTLFVGNNSGPKHIAAALGVPTVGIHSGVVDAREWGPMGTTACAIHRVMACSPCYHSKLEDCGRGLSCLRGLMPADVLRICLRLLEAATATNVRERARRLPAQAATTV